MMASSTQQVAKDDAQIGVQLSPGDSDLQCASLATNNPSDLTSKEMERESIEDTDPSTPYQPLQSSQFSNFDVEADSGEDREIDMTGDEKRPSHTHVFSANKPSYPIPSFEELHKTGQINLKDPEPGRLGFPGHFGLDRRQIAWKDLVRGTQGRILPPPQEPLWKQMQSYCQLWGTWIATIENEQRRGELMNWVTLRMKEAWETGIKLGHCGDPTGHTTCCSSHKPMNISSGEGESFSRRKQVREFRKKPVDQSKQPAPFAYDGNKASHSIINKELETAGISMDAILRQVTLGLDAGEDLMADMTRRLEGRAVQLPDWTHIKLLNRFDPRIHQRNLVMYCLWEVQRCRNLVTTLEVFVNKPGTTFHQQKNIQKRIDSHRDRAEQHLALAIVLDDRSSANDNDVEDEDEEQSESDGIIRKSSRAKSAGPVIEVMSDENESDIDMEKSTGERSTSPESSSDDRSYDHNEAGGEIDLVNQKSPFLLTGEAQPTKDLKRSSAIDDDVCAAEELASKRPKLDHEIVDNNKADEKVLNLDHQDQHLSSSSDHAAEDLSSMFSQQPPNAKYPQPTQSIEHSLFNDADNSSEENNSIPDEAYLKRMYIRQMWQPRINAILDSNGFNQLDEELTGWPDIRGVIHDLGFDESIRNQLLREFKQGFEAWRIWMKQQHAGRFTISQHQAQQPVAHASQQSVQPMSLAEPDPKNEMQTTRKGFSFWYAADTTKAERSEMDDTIMEYHQWILTEQTNRFGYYVVFVDPYDKSRKLAHGIWNLRRNRRPEDADWFYRNDPMPNDFRQSQPNLWHQWGYSMAPPNSNSRSKPRSKHARESAQNTDRESSVAGSRARKSESCIDRGTASGRVTKRKHTKSNNRKRRNVIDDDEDDEDYFPGTF